MVDKARAAHGDKLPDWIEELARQADAAGLKGAGAPISYSPATVSQVIGGTYRGDLSRVEEMVRGAFMKANVDCPVLGRIGRDDCLKNQKARLSTASPLSNRLYWACRAGCPHARKGGRHAE
ncbi:hypothetical protein CH339_04875 [Rhodobium orientis]|uniref:Transcriptional regulator n=2 Tax=Rhodobium orientis TaxID=34017 RepID=A0A327JSK1_9HYPH|nr:hypothetical protein [Rhodobium orientis]RAI29041.1 hypothetical protein CH339_04875 [Rhodobium orientis]